MKKITLASILFSTFIILNIIVYIGYNTLYPHLKESEEFKVQSLFYDIEFKASNFLIEVYRCFEKKHKDIIDIHKKFAKKLESGKSFETIVNELNQINKPLNIYLADKNLIIQKSSFTKDIGFNLSFAKEKFEEDSKKKIIGISPPIFEQSINNFLTYTNSFIHYKNEKWLMQMSYTNKDLAKDFKKLREEISLYNGVEKVEIYSILDNGFVNKILFENLNKPTIKELQTNGKEAKEILSKLKDKELHSEKIFINKTPYRKIYLMVEHPFIDNAKLLYTILLNNSLYYKKDMILNHFVIAGVFLVFIILLVLIFVKKKEDELSEYDIFIQSYTHQIQTPITVIQLYNNMLEEINKDYTGHINSALQIIKIAHNDMGFLKDNRSLKKRYINSREEILLKEVVEDRIKYFKGLINAYELELEYNQTGEAYILFSLLDLKWLIDNNLSNSIKYAKRNSLIRITLEDNKLTFFTKSEEPIKNTKLIFKKRKRENTTEDGQGLGLFIVSSIAKQYKVGIEVLSNKKGTSFIYSFKKV